MYAATKTYYGLPNLYSVCFWKPSFSNEGRQLLIYYVFLGIEGDTGSAEGYLISSGSAEQVD